jgi:hypothetical protein
VTLSSSEELVNTQGLVAELQQTIAMTRRRLSASPHSQVDLIHLYENQLRELQNEVDEFLGISHAHAGVVELGFETRDGSRGVTTLSALGQAVDALRGAITSIAENLAEGTVREVGRPKVRIARAVDLRVVGVSEGSFNLELEYPIPEEGEAENLRDLAERSLNVLEDGLRWVDRGGESPPVSLESEGLRKVVLSEIRKLSPTPGGPISWIQVRRQSPLRLPPVRATAETLRKANAISERSIRTEARRIVGRLREIDLDRATFELVGSEGARVTCAIDSSLAAEALEHIAAQRVVMVTGTLTNKKLQVETMEPIRGGGES